MNFQIILNPFARKGKAFHRIKLIEKYFKKLNMDYEMSITDSPKQAINFALGFANRGFKNIIAAGGDGTINEVVNGIMLSDNPDDVNFGIISIGGGNDFVKNLDYPRKIKSQIKILRAGYTKKIDIGKIENQYFINTLGIGFDAQVAINYKKNKIISGFPGYLAAVLKTLIRNKSYSVNIETDNSAFSKRIKFITVGNGVSCGGKFHLTPDAKIDDGLFDFCIIDSISRRRILKLLPKTTKGKHVGYDEVHIARGKKISVSSSHKLPLYFDGEIPDLIDKRNFTIEMIPHKINLIVGG